jgi:glycosyltransferase involved in cell wall biosynthesis
MKILQLVQQPQRRGAEIFTYQLSSHLLELGHQVKIVYLYPGPPENVLSLRNEDVIVGSDPLHFSETIPGWNPKMVFAFDKILKNFQPEVVQLNGARTVKYGALLRFLNPSSRWALVYRNIGDPLVWQKGRLKREFFKHFAFSKIDGMVAVNSNSFQSLKRISPQKLIALIPRAVDPKYFSPDISRNKIRNLTNTPEDSPVLIYVGSLTPEKRVDRLIQAFCLARVTIPELHLWIVGSGPLAGELRNQVNGSEFASWIHFLGPQENVASYVNASDLLLLTSDTEGIPGVVLEAGLLEVPSIATNVGGVSECIANQQTGILIQSKEPIEIKDAIVELIHNEGKRLQMGRNAKEWILSNFSIKKIAEEYLEFYSEVITARNRRKQTAVEDSKIQFHEL